MVLAPTKLSMVDPRTRKMVAPMKRKMVAPTESSMVAPMKRKMVAPTTIVIVMLTFTAFTQGHPDGHEDVKEATGSGSMKESGKRENAPTDPDLIRRTSKGGFEYNILPN